jgi:hypothetical protein
MKFKAAFLVALVPVLVQLLPSEASSQTRINFRPGAVRADVSGTLNSFRSRRIYVIRIRAGQTLSTRQIGGDKRPVTIAIKDPNGEDVGDSDASCNDRREIARTIAGDYRIEVVECRKADPWRGRFTFRVTVR